MDLAYVAHSSRCALLLDSEGICRWVVPKVEPNDPGASEIVSAARRCIGAQYVATLDPDVEGLLGHEPRVGKTLLFAAVTRGRVALVRFGPLVAFESLEAGVAQASTAPERSDEAKTPEARAEDAPQHGRDEDVVVGGADVVAVSGSSQTSNAEAIEEISTGNLEDHDEDADDEPRGAVAPVGLSSPALASFLDDVEELAESSYSRSGVRSDDASEIEITTGSFGPVSVPIAGVLGTSWDLAETRVLEPGDVPRDDDSDDDDSAEEIEITDEPLVPEAAAVETAHPPLEAEHDEQRPLRPSGFVVRRAPDEDAPSPDRATTPALASVAEDESEGEATCRFSRAIGSKSAPPSEEDVDTTRTPAPRLAPRRLAP